MPPAKPTKFLTTNQAAKFLRVHPRTLRRYKNQGLLAPSHTHGKTTYYAYGDVAQLKGSRYKPYEKTKRTLTSIPSLQTQLEPPSPRRAATEPTHLTPLASPAIQSRLAPPPSQVSSPTTPKTAFSPTRVPFTPPLSATSIPSKQFKTYSVSNTDTHRGWLPSLL